MVLQEDLNKVADWCSKWKMNINIDKTKVLSLSRAKNVHPPTYTIAGNTLKTVDKLSILGVTINNKLTWENHVNRLCSKANADTRFINRVLAGTPSRTRELVFNSLIRSKLEYCSSVWDPPAQNLIGELEMVQRRGARMVFNNFRRHTCVTEMMNNLNWQTLQTRRRDRRLAMMYKIYHQETILDPQDYFEQPDYMGRHDNSKKIKRYQCKRGVFANSFFPKTICDWNALADETVLAPNQTAFNKLVELDHGPITCSHTEQ